MLLKIVLGLIAMAIALAFYAIPIIKLQKPALVIVVLIGVAMMVRDFIDMVREKDD